MGTPFNYTEPRMLSAVITYIDGYGKIKTQRVVYTDDNNDLTRTRL